MTSRSDFLPDQQPKMATIFSGGGLAEKGFEAAGFEVVTAEQRALGWSDAERLNLMQWFYQHRDRTKRVRKAA